MRISESQLRRIINEEVSMSVLSEQGKSRPDAAATAAAAKATVLQNKDNGNLIVWKDEDHFYYVDYSKDDVRTKKLTAPNWIMNPDPRSRTAILAVAAQLKDRPPAAAGGGVAPAPVNPKPGDPKCNLQQYENTFSQAMQKAAIAEVHKSVVTEVAFRGTYAGKTSAALRQAAARIYAAPNDDSLKSSIENAFRTGAAMVSGGLSTGLTTLMAGILSAEAEFIDNRMQAFTAFAKDCDFKKFGEGLVKAFSTFLSRVRGAFQDAGAEVMNFWKRSAQGLLDGLVAVLTATGVGAIMSASFLMELLDSAINKAAETIKAVSDAIRNAIAEILMAISRGAASVSTASAKAADAVRPAPAGAPLSESVRRQRVVTQKRMMKQLALEMHRYATAHQLLAEMTVDNRRFFLQSAI